jgi:hypothetical protein
LSDGPGTAPPLQLDAVLQRPVVVVSIQVRSAALTGMTRIMLANATHAATTPNLIRPISFMWVSYGVLRPSSLNMENDIK